MAEGGKSLADAKQSTAVQQHVVNKITSAEEQK